MIAKSSHASFSREDKVGCRVLRRQLQPLIDIVESPIRPCANPQLSSNYFPRTSHIALGAAQRFRPPPGSSARRCDQFVNRRKLIFNPSALFTRPKSKYRSHRKESNRMLFEKSERAYVQGMRLAQDASGKDRKHQREKPVASQHEDVHRRKCICEQAELPRQF